ncbi:MAPEG family protein [bacterium]|nr:MAPEG family protein [bacterium]
MNDLILEPAIIMCLLSFFMMIWMYATRLPAAKKLEEDGVDIQKFSHPSSIGGVFPSKVERVADNYNHLFEQPTVFYAMSFIIWGLEHTDSVHLYCAWAYVIIRITHSILQATLNLVWFRFSLFILSWVALAIMIFREALFII